MWRWDQGHLPYFQFDSLRQIAAFVVSRNIKTATRAELLASVGLDFAAPPDYSLWRQYARVLKLCLLVSESPNRRIASPTPVAELLSHPGQTTSDEYFHFLSRAFTEPSPAFTNWRPNAVVRYPLLFCLKYLLAKKAIDAGDSTNFAELFGAYEGTGFSGDEEDIAFINAVQNRNKWSGISPKGGLRQERESLAVLCQISYLHLAKSRITVSLDRADAHEIFHDLTPITGPRANDRDAEVRRLADLFKDGAIEDFYDYPHTAGNDVVQSGFTEGTKVKKTHLVIERNQELRRSFFEVHPQALCDVCTLDTGQTYPWTSRVLDLHHLLPLSSGTRVIKAGRQTGTTFDDLVAICPTCHRAVHRFYDGWLVEQGLQDFINDRQARETYQAMKHSFGGSIYGQHVV